MVKCSNERNKRLNYNWICRVQSKHIYIKIHRVVFFLVVLFCIFTSRTDVIHIDFNTSRVASICKQRICNVTFCRTKRLPVNIMYLKVIQGINIDKTLE